MVRKWPKGALEPPRALCCTLNKAWDIHRLAKWIILELKSLQDPQTSLIRSLFFLGAAENLSREFQRTPSRPRHCFESVRGREPTRGASAGCFPPGYSRSRGVGATRAAGGMLTARGITEVTTEQQPWDFFTRNRGNCSFLRCAACILRG